MKSVLSQLWLVAALAQLAVSQQTLWGQCGGIGYTGSTKCVTTATCTEYNPYYFQCIPGAATTTVPTSTRTTTTTTKTPSTTSSKTTTTKSTTTTTTKSTTTKTTTTKTTTTKTTTTKTTTTSTTTKTTTKSSTTSSSSITKSSTSAGACATAAFTSVGAAPAFASLMPGINIGNTFDAIPDETSWGNTVKPSNLETIKNRGFKSVRLPVTWEYHLINQEPTWTINSTWLDRVEFIVDESLKRGLWVILTIRTYWERASTNYLSNLIGSLKRLNNTF